ncbi:hypothetical protein PM082_007427 [Marasmius tenuissimus]|nr:hypothetical protein PM082_007427 [Marasmius tenuissimus]
MQQSQDDTIPNIYSVMAIRQTLGRQNTTAIANITDKPTSNTHRHRGSQFLPQLCHLALVYCIVTSKSRLMLLATVCMPLDLGSHHVSERTHNRGRSSGHIDRGQRGRSASMALLTTKRRLLVYKKASAIPQ